MSLLIPHTDKEEWNEMIIKVNESLSSLCAASRIPCIPHSNIDGKRHLNRGGVHLNWTGTSVLVGNLIRFLKDWPACGTRNLGKTLVIEKTNEKTVTLLKMIA